MSPTFWSALCGAQVAITIAAFPTSWPYTAAICWGLVVFYGLMAITAAVSSGVRQMNKGSS